MRYETSETIVKTKSDIISAVKVHIEKELSDIKKIIAEIEEMLKSRDLSDSILGND